MAKRIGRLYCMRTPNENKLSYGRPSSEDNTAGVRGVALGKPGAWNGIQGASVKCGEREVVIDNGNTEQADVYAPASGARLYPLLTSLALLLWHCSSAWLGPIVATRSFDLLQTESGAPLAELG
jgi:hypothetical protein